jgi:hypothetical protein
VGPTAVFAQCRMPLVRENRAPASHSVMHSHVWQFEAGLCCKAACSRTREVASHRGAPNSAEASCDRRDTVVGTASSRHGATGCQAQRRSQTAAGIRTRCASGFRPLLLLITMPQQRCPIRGMQLRRRSNVRPARALAKVVVRSFFSRLAHTPTSLLPPGL